MLLSCGCREQIVHNLSESEANRLLTRLHDSSIDAAKEHQTDGKWLISVDSTQSLEAIKFLDSARLLRDPAPSIEARSSMIASREEQRIRSENVLSQSIQDTLMSIDGVLEAHVHLNLPPSDPLFGYKLNGTSGSASVLLVVEENLRVAKEDIMGLVAGASGILAKDVTVLVSEGTASPTPHALPIGQVERTESSGFSPFSVPSSTILMLSALALVLLASGLWAHLYRTRASGEGKA